MTAPRTRADACPGVLAPHDAADGALARVRLPGGVVTAAQLRVLAGCAEDLGDGAVHLTSRGNLQLRGLDRADPRLGSRLVSAGLLPSTTHERVRNIVASPLSGVDGGVADVRGLAAVVDALLCATPELSALPGRFLVALDDGRGDVAAEEPDLCWFATAADRGSLLVAGVPTGLGCAPRDAPSLLVAAAEAFLTLRTEDTGCTSAWRAAEIDDAPARIAAALARIGTPSDGDPHLGSAAVAQRPLRSTGVDLVGVLGGRAVGVAPVLGELSAAQLRALAHSAPEVLVTPWRTLLLPDPEPGAADRLRAAGLVTEPGDPALQISACAGRPGCAKSLADVRGDVRALLADLRHDTRGPADSSDSADTGSRGVTTARAHVVGCGRRCGAPHGPHRDVVARPDGTYEIDGLQAGLRALLESPA
ncbi:precorrin-3B synthase [Pseudonocardia xishanensis]|uniref:precorrin-3B synthase n=1 Tax=Pseudonocardia xishanensis TaxID=630995 RepID=UPI0031EB651E